MARNEFGGWGIPAREVGPTVIDKSQLIGSIGSRLRDHTHNDSGVRAQTILSQGPC